MEHRQIVNKIRKLLSLSTSMNEHEAAAAANKAQQLLSKYNLALEAVSLEEDAAKAQSIRRRTRQRLDGWAYRLAGGTAKAFDCDYYHDRTRGETVFVGVGADPEVCGWMYSYLYKTLLRLSAGHMLSVACRRLRLNASKKNARESYLLGATVAIVGRLARQKHITPITPGALVLAKESMINAAMPADITIRAAKPVKLRDQDWLAGRRSGAQVPLSTPISNASPSRLALRGSQ